MSDRDIDVNLTTLSDSELLAEMQKRRQEKKVKLVSVLERGYTGDRLHVDLTSTDKYGEWVPNTKEEIYRMQTMGFDIDREIASSRALHSDGSDGASIVGDVIFMTCDRETKELIDEIKQENYNATNNPRGGRQKEERDFIEQANVQGMPSEIKSRTDSATAEQIRAALISQ